MRKLLALTLTIWLAVFISATAQANEVTLDPTQPGQTTLTITCDYNLEREDGSLMVIGDIAKVSFFVEKNGTGVWSPAGENTTACHQVYDMSAIPDGVYVYAVTETDTDGRESLHSIDVVTATVKRIRPPGSPSGTTGLVS